MSSPCLPLLDGKTWENMRKLCWVFRMVHTQARGSFPSMHLTVKRFNPTRARNLGSLCVCVCVCVFQIERGREGGRARGGRASLSRARCARAPGTEGWSRARRPHRVMLSARRETCARVTFSGVGSAVSVRASGRRERRLPRPPSFRAAASSRVGPPLLRFGIQLNFTSLSRVFGMLRSRLRLN